MLNYQCNKNLKQRTMFKFECLRDSASKTEVTEALIAAKAQLDVGGIKNPKRHPSTFLKGDES